LGANKHFEYQTAYRMFMKASRLRPTEPAHLISAANMKLKLLRLDDAERLYERAWGMAELTAAQRRMVGEKRLLLRRAGAWGGDFALKAMGVPQELGPPRPAAAGQPSPPRRRDGRCGEEGTEREFIHIG